jgi:hypothetical protein
MTETHTNTPETKDTENIIKMVADDMLETMATSQENPISALQTQVKLLNYLHTRMIEEAMPNIEKNPYRKKHDVHRLSLALRAQNQFCRTVMLMAHLEDREKTANELSNKKSIK